LEIKSLVVVFEDCRARCVTGSVPWPKYFITDDRSMVAAQESQRMGVYHKNLTGHPLVTASQETIDKDERQQHS
jgi:hypothetical protein